MSVPTFGKPVATSEGDLFPVKDNEGHTLIIKPKAFNPSRPTKNAPEGAPCVVVDLVDLDDASGQFVYRDVPLFGGALVDSTKPALDSGEVLLCRVRLQTNRAGSRQYPVLDGIDDDGRAAEFYRRNGDPFAPQFAAPAQPQQPQQGYAPQQQGYAPQQQAPQNYAPQQQPGYGQPQAQQWGGPQPQPGAGAPY